jgi:ice-binding like protein
MLTILRPSAQRAVVLLCAALVAGAWGCRTASGPCPITTLTVTPNPAIIVQGTTRQFTATGRDYKGNILSTSASWAVVAGGGAINAGSGLFTAGATLGTFPNTVRATSGGLTGYATVTVIGSPGPLATITVSPNPATIVINGTQQFVATGRDANGNVVAITPTWSVFAGGGAINSGSGQFTAGATTGTFSNTVRATQGSIFGSATVIVTGSGPPPATLGAAGTFSVLGGVTVTNTGVTTTITGNVGVSPGNAITGIPAGQPTAGSIHAGDAVAATAQGALTTAYNDLAGRACGTNLTSLDLGGMTLSEGVYCFSSTAGLTGTLTLTGNANSVFVFQIGSALTTASNATVNLIGGAVANNVYWQIGSSATLGTGTAFKGNIVALQSITLNTNASLSGRALARNGAVTLDTNAITLP